MCLSVLLLVGFIGFKIDISARSARHASALESQAQRLQQQKNLANSVARVLAANPDITFSVSAIDLSSNSYQNFGSSDPMEAASVAKLITAALYLHQVEIGRASLNDNLGDNTAGYELQQLIQQSDDTTWAMFNDELGHDALINYAQTNGWTSYDPDANTIDTADVAKLLQKLYQGKLLNPQHTKVLLSYMQNTNYEDLITPAVPSGDTIYHKVGLIDDDVNDAAIITNGRSSFMLVIFTDGHGAQDWDARALDMQQIAKAAISAYLK